MNKLLSINSLNKSYTNTKVIKDLSFDIYEGEILSLIGSSGCGKSTILNIISNLDDKYEGTINKFKDIKIGYMLQEDSLFPWLSVKDNALIGLKVKKELNKDNIKYVDNLLNKYGLKKHKNKNINSLSGGERQRLALIRTLAIKPNLILLDEAFSKLDYVTKLRVSTDVKNIIKEEKITAIMVTHDLNEAINLSDRIILLGNNLANIVNVYSVDSNNYSEYYNKILKDINL